MLSYLTSEILDIRPSWDNLSDNNFRDAKVEPLNNGIATGFDSRQNIRRQLKLSFLLCNKREIDCFEAFVERHKGRAHGFWIPIWTISSPVNGVTFTNQVGMNPATMRYSIETLNLKQYYDTTPDQFKHFLIDNSTSMRGEAVATWLTNTSTNTDTLVWTGFGSWGAAYDQLNAQVVPMMFGRFASDDFSYFYVGDGKAVIHCRFVELPKEYTTAVTPTTKTYCYDFVNKGTSYRYTEYVRDLTAGGNLYSPANIFHERIQRNGNFLDEGVNINLRTDDANNLVRKFLSPSDNTPTSVTISYADVNSISDTATLTTEFTGEVDELQYRETGSCKLQCSTAFKRGRTGVVPTQTLQKKCNWSLYSNQCGLVEANYTSTDTVVSANGIQVVHNSNFANNGAGDNPNVDDYFTHGKLTINNEVRTVMKYVAATNTIYINSPFSVTPAASDSISVTAGCQKTANVCSAKFNNSENFGGFALLPKSPTWLEALNVDDKNRGGKK